MLLAAAALLACLFGLRSPLGFLLAASLVAWALVVAFTLALSPFRAARPASTWGWLGATLALSAGVWLARGMPRPPLGGVAASVREAVRDPAVAVVGVFA